MFKIEEVIEKLARGRPVFHSEADFQHALAWEIHKTNADAQIRLEINLNRFKKRDYLDILVKDKNRLYAIELKYKTQKIDISWNSEEFHLLEQSAQDWGRYDFIKDMTRLEKFINLHQNSMGYVIMITNDDYYWTPPRRIGAADADFRIHEGRKLQGKLKWGKGISSSTIKDRENPLILQGSYSIHWSNYSLFPENGFNRFRYLLIKI